MKRSDRETGSLASYIIVGVLLTIVLVSGLYGVQRYNDSQEEGGTNQPTDKDTDKDEAPVEETPVDETPATDDGSGNAPVEDTDDTTDGSSTEEGLPATGPEDTALTAIVLAVVAFALTHFVHSRYWTSRSH